MACWIPLLHRNLGQPPSSPTSACKEAWQAQRNVADADFQLLLDVQKNMAKGNPKYCLHPLPNKYNARIWYTPFKNDAPWSFPSLGPRHELSQTQEGLLCRASCCKTIKRSSWAQHQMVPANILAARKEASNICSKQPGRNFEYLKDRKKLTGHVTPIKIGP